MKPGQSQARPTPTSMRPLDGPPEHTTPALLKLDRRTFLKATGLAGSGLMLGATLSCQQRDTGAKQLNGKTVFAPGAWLQISAERILIYTSKPELGQGINTALPMIVVEELDADWASVVVEQAPVDNVTKRFGSQGAGNSSSVPDQWDILRRVGATARWLLIQTAATRWGTDSTSCETHNGFVVHSPSGRRFDYRELAEDAATLPLPDAAAITLKQPENYRLLGQRISGVDNRAIVQGRPLYSSDQQLSGMKYAVYQKCPAHGGSVKSANLDEIRQMPGVIDTFVLQGNGVAGELLPGIAIVADNTWAAIKAKRALRVQWDETHAAKDSWTEAAARATNPGLEPATRTVAYSGDVDATAASGARQLEAHYQYHFVSHAPMEPQSCTAWYREGQVTLWSASQNAQGAVYSVSRNLGLEPSRFSPERIARKLGWREHRVNIHQLRAGGSFGRRAFSDPECEAAVISQRVGLPIKLQWTREDEMAHDLFRAGGFHTMGAAVDSAGELIALSNHSTSFTADGHNPVIGGHLNASEFPLDRLDHFRLIETLLPWRTPCGFWRAPGANVHAFVTQSFLHEISQLVGRDHRQFLLDLLRKPSKTTANQSPAFDSGRAAAVIERATAMADWGAKPPTDRAQGLAFYYSHRGYVAQVAEVSVSEDKALRVHTVHVAVDIGRVINLSGAENQCEGSVIDGLSTLMGLAISHEQGRIQQTNFDTYPLLRMPQAPRVNVQFIESDQAPTGIGEPALPPLAPAVCNAIFTATAERVRTMPLAMAGFSAAI